MQVADRIGVERTAVAVDRAPNRRGVRREQERAEVDAVAAEPELRANARPRKRRELLGVSLVRGGQRLRPENRGGGERQPAALQEFPPVERHSLAGIVALVDPVSDTQTKV